MRIRKELGVALLGLTTLLLVTGCPFASLENYVTWGVKAAAGNLTATTATEWVSVAAFIDERTPETDVSLTEEQAQAIVDFLVANNLNKVADITYAIEHPEQLEIPDSLIDLLGDLSLEDVFGGISG